MVYDKENDQWINDGFFLYGEGLKDAILSKGHNVITAGNVMVFTHKSKPYLMFQLLQDLKLDEHLKNIGLIGYEAGSILFNVEATYYRSIIPTIRFRDCRMPSYREFEDYKKRKTI